MIPKKINRTSKNFSILVVPLDWGLGHATRCIPLIRELLVNGCDVTIGAEKATLELLKNEFQQVTFIPIEGYRIRYSKEKRWLPLKIVMQLPRILLSIYKEHQWLKKVVEKRAFHAIIADNRFGLYNRGIYSVYITHQLLIKTGVPWLEVLLQKLHYWYIKRFSSCWVPDFEGSENISGALAHPAKRPSNLQYIGGLSRFEKKAGTEKRYGLLLLISGPEPQRSIFETLLLEQLKDYLGRAMMVRGLPGSDEGEGVLTDLKKRLPHVTIKNHLSAVELNMAVQQAGMVVSRSGYTTIMDLLKLQQKAILVPTPGQTEQEYLAKHLMDQRFFFSTMQEGFDLQTALKAAAGFPFLIPSFDMEQYRQSVYRLVQSL